MKLKGKLAKRVRILYAIFILVILCSVVRELIPAFSRGVDTGMNKMKVKLEEQKIDKKSDITFPLFLMITSDKNDFRSIIPLLERPQEVNGTIFKASIINEGESSIFDIDVENGKPQSLTFLLTYTGLSWCVIILKIAIIVFIFLILNSLRKSVVSEDVFNIKNLRYLHWIGFLYIISSLFSGLFEYIINSESARYMGEYGFDLIPRFNIDFDCLVFGLVILLIAEVFVIGYKLSEEQQLTV